MSWGSLTSSEVDFAERRLCVRLAGENELKRLSRKNSQLHPVPGKHFGGAGLNITGSDHPEQVQGIHVSASYFALFGAPVVAGRTFTATEDSPHGGHVTVLSYGLWKSRYGADPKWLGPRSSLTGNRTLLSASLAAAL